MQHNLLAEGVSAGRPDVEAEELLIANSLLRQEVPGGFEAFPVDRTVW